MIYTQHPLSAAFPAMQAEDFQALKDSIENIGVQNPITLLDGMVIDGWHRYRVATDLGMECPSVDLGGDIDPRDFVLAQNKMRRHITVAQLAMAANAVYQWRAAGRPAGNSAGTAELKQPEIAKNAGVSVRSLRQADEVAKNAAPVVIEAISRGDVGLEKAAAIAKLPQSEQAAAIHKPLPKAKPAPVSDRDAHELEEAAVAINELAAENEQLRDRLAVEAMDASEDEKTAAAQTIAELRHQIRTLEAELAATRASRDGYQRQNSELMKQVQIQQRQLKKAA